MFACFVAVSSVVEQCAMLEEDYELLEKSVSNKTGLEGEKRWTLIFTMFDVNGFSKYAVLEEDCQLLSDRVEASRFVFVFWKVMVICC